MSETEGKEQILTVPPEAAGERLDRWLAATLPTLSRSYVGRLIGDGAVTVNGQPAGKSGQRVSAGEQVHLRLPPPPDPVPQPEPITLAILYEDDDVIVINKPAGMVVHPAPGHEGGTLVNALLAYTPIEDPDQPGRPGIVHRLDRDTSGVLITARHAAARRALQQQFRRRETEKKYVALVQGLPETPRGTIEGPIGRHPTRRQRRAVVSEGRAAVTHYETVRRYDGMTLLDLRPVTGRTHQIRVHLEAIGLPVVGDVLYGPRRGPLPELGRHFLHAAALTIRLPDGQLRTFEAPLPPELTAALDTLRPLD